MDTAAVLKNLDLVISVDTAIAHLAGALGIPVWVALPFAPDWRWLMEREDSPWYPTMRLFRQTRPGQWEDVFQRIAEALQRRLAAPVELRPITVEIAPGELIDKITILEIKSERITDAAKRHHVGTELAPLVAARDRVVPGSAELARLATELKAVNEARWQIEDEIRLCERDEDFGPRFVALAPRSIAPTIGVPPSSAKSMSCSVPSSSKRSHTRPMRRGSTESGGAWKWREVLTHPERLILTHLVLQDSRSGQGRQFRFTPPFGSSWTSSTRESGSSRRSSRRSGNDASGGPKAPRSSARPGRSGSTR